MPLYRIIAFFLLALCAVTSSAQQPEFRHFTVENGLPSNEVYHVLEDRKGYLWFSTDRGVCRFNGNEFENFTTDDGLPDNTVILSYEDYLGRIWFVSFSPLLSYYQNNAMHEFQYNDSIRKMGLKKSNKVSLQVDKNYIYVGTSKEGYYQIDSLGNVEVFTDVPGIYIIKKPLGYFLFVSYTPKTYKKSIKQIHFHGRDYDYKRLYVPSLKVYQGINKIYFSDGTNLFTIIDSSLIHEFISPDRIQDIYEDNNKKLWLGYKHDGIKKIDISDSNRVTGHYLNGKSISCISVDIEGGMWFTTVGNGIYYIPPGTNFEQPFKNRLPDEKVEDIIYTDNGTAYVSYTGGTIWEISPSMEVQMIDSFNSPIHLGGFNPLAYNNQTGQLITGPITNRLILAECDKLVAYNIKEYDSKYDCEHFDYMVFSSLDSDDNGGYWVSTHWGVLYIRDNKLEKIIRKTEVIGKVITDTVPRFRVDDFFLSKNNRIYLSTMDGLYELQNDRLFQMADKHPLLNSRIDDIQSWNGDTLLLASRGNGLIIYDGDSAISINIDNGLSNNLVNSICRDDEGFIWAGTNNGLNRIKWKGSGDFDIDHFTTVHGLPSNHISKVIATGDHLWVGTLKGISKLNRKHIESNKIPPRIGIRQMKVNEKDTSVQNGYRFSYNNNMIYFAFTGIAFKNRGSLTYQYQLEGLDNHWQTTSSHEIRFNSLPYGKYTFKVKAVNEDGFWSDPVTVNFEILSPIWFRWWFILLDAVAIISIVIIVVKLRERRIREKANTQKRAAQLQLNALRAQMNPHFTFNTLSSIQEYILKNDSVQANDYLSLFAGLIRKVLENSRHSGIPLNQEIDTLKMYLELEKLRFRDKLEFEIETDPELDIYELDIPPTLIQPFVENSIIHGISHKKNGGLIRIKFLNHQEGLKCIITDNGIGRKEAAKIMVKGLNKEKSLGLEITRERLALMNKSGTVNYRVTITDLENEEGEARGTRVEIYLPKNN